MKKALTISFLLIFYTGFTFAQLLPGQPGAYKKMAIVKIKQPLVIIGTLETNYNSLVIDPANLRIIKTYQDSLQLAAFGEKGKEGVVLAEIKNKIPLLRLEEVLDYYKIPAPNRTLKVMVNKALINSDLFLADVQRIEKIEKIKQDLAAPFRYSFDKDEEYLNIVTVKD